MFKLQSVKYTAMLWESNSTWDLDSKCQFISFTPLGLLYSTYEILIKMLRRQCTKLKELVWMCDSPVPQSDSSHLSHQLFNAMQKWFSATNSHAHLLESSVITSIIYFCKQQLSDGGSIQILDLNRHHVTWSTLKALSKKFACFHTLLVWVLFALFSSHFAKELRLF